MIAFEITDCPDKNTVSQFKYFQNQIYLGRSSGDLWIKDNSLLPSHCMLEVIGKELLFHPQKDVEFYLLNGKRASAIRKLKPNDQITIGDTVIKITAFEETEEVKKKDVLNRKLNQLIEEESPKIPVIERLTKLMKQ